MTGLRVLPRSHPAGPDSLGPCPAPCKADPARLAARQQAADSAPLQALARGHNHIGTEYLSVSNHYCEQTLANQAATATLSRPDEPSPITGRGAHPLAVRAGSRADHPLLGRQDDTTPERGGAQNGRSRVWRRLPCAVEGRDLLLRPPVCGSASPRRGSGRHGWRSSSCSAWRVIVHGVRVLPPDGLAPSGPAYQGSWLSWASAS